MRKKKKWDWSIVKKPTQRRVVINEIIHYFNNRSGCRVYSNPFRVRGEGSEDFVVSLTDCSGNKVVMVVWVRMQLHLSFTPIDMNPNLKRQIAEVENSLIVFRIVNSLKQMYDIVLNLEKGEV